MQQEVLKHRLDAHLHLQTIPWNSCFQKNNGKNIIKSFIGSGNESICNGTSPMDWDLVTSLVKLFPGDIIPYYGVHPWYVDSLPENWLIHLQTCLVKSGAGLGEIGLDRSYSSKAAFDHQKAVFAAQLNLALTLNRPVSIHCVRSWGALMEILEEKTVISIDNNKYCKIPIMIHSFSGSIETMKRLIDIGVFISFSSYLRSIQAEDLRYIFQAIPLERILIESDFSYSKSIPVNSQILDYNRNMSSLYKIAGELKNMSSEQFQEEIYLNGKIFTDRALNRQ